MRTSPRSAPNCVGNGLCGHIYLLNGAQPPPLVKRAAKDGEGSWLIASVNLAYPAQP